MFPKRMTVSTIERINRKQEHKLQDMMGNRIALVEDRGPVGNQGKKLLLHPKGRDKFPNHRILVEIHNSKGHQSRLRPPAWKAVS